MTPPVPQSKVPSTELLGSLKTMALVPSEWSSPDVALVVPA